MYFIVIFGNLFTLKATHLRCYYLRHKVSLDDLYAIIKEKSVKTTTKKELMKNNIISMKHFLS